VPTCAEIDEKFAIFRDFSSSWKLVSFGVVQHLEPLRFFPQVKADTSDSDFSETKNCSLIDFGIDENENENENSAYN
nr:hypothetical protein [Nitrosopumilus sp.]